MINLRSIGTTCDQCDDCMSVVHSVTAECWVWGFRRVSINAAEMTFNPWMDGDVNLIFSHDAYRPYRTLTISGITAAYGDPSINGTHTITDWTLGPATAAQDAVFATYSYSLTPHSSRRMGAVTNTAAGFTHVIEVWNGSSWVTDTTISFQLSDPITDEDIVAHLDGLLDGIDWSDVLLFDDAHDFSYTVFKVPTLVAGLVGHDQYCAGDMLSTSSAGDTIIASNRGWFNRGRKVASGYGLSCFASSDSTVAQLWKGPYASLTTGLLAARAFKQRVRLPSPVSYSHSVYYDPVVERDVNRARWPETDRIMRESQPFTWHINTDHFADLRHGLSSWVGIEDNPTAAPYDRWVTSGTCANVRHQTSTSSAETINAPDLVPLATGYAQQSARVIRQGIRCQDNYPPQFNYP